MMRKYYRVQRGRGLGSFLRNIFKFFVPVVKKVASNKTVRKIGKDLVNRGLDSAKDVIRGEPVKNIVNREKKFLKDKAVKVINKVSKKINENRNDNTNKESVNYKKGKKRKTNTAKNLNSKKKKSNKISNSPYLF